MIKRALLIGVSDYEPGLNPLPAAVNDITAMQRVLLDPELGGFAEAELLANPDSQTMQYAIETLFSRCTRDDLVVLFFSGHGVIDNGRLYFASRNTQKTAQGDLMRSTAVPTHFVHDSMNRSRCKRQVIILDCCYSGAFDPALQAKDDGAVDLRGQLGAEGRVVLASSSSTEYSFAQPGADLSIYTRYLVEGMETGAGDRDEDGWVSVLELHEYAVSKVQETAPQMTPKIIVMKDKGFEIKLAKARVTDPRLKYRKMATRYANAGTIRPAGRAVLNRWRQELGLTVDETTEIEAEVLRPYQERLANLAQYRETLIAEAEHEYPLGEVAREDLQTLQQMLGLRDEDILPIQQAVEAQFAQQAAAYAQNLVQYEQALTVAIQQEFPFSPATRQALDNLPQSLGLRAEDIMRIASPLIQSAERSHQEQLSQAAEQRRQAQAKADYENKRQRYEQEFAQAVQAEYPLSEGVLAGLKNLQQQLGLKDEEIVSLERSHREPAEAKYQAARQQQAQTFEFETATIALTPSGLLGRDHKLTIERRPGRAEFYRETLGAGVELDLVKVPGGKFMMGAAQNEEGASGDEYPQHQVTVKPFYLGKYPVTQAQWAAIAALPKINQDLNPDPANFKGSVGEASRNENRPVEQISWWEAVEFCDRLSKKTGRTYRLPTEAEWEYACRAGTTTPFHFGEILSTELANYDGNYTYGAGKKGEYRKQTTSVGMFPANAFGVYDMHGNVWEWCLDHQHDNYKNAPHDGSAWLTQNNDANRLLRGGSWNRNPALCRAADRYWHGPAYRLGHVGLRVVAGVA